MKVKAALLAACCVAVAAAVGRDASPCQGTNATGKFRRVWTFAKLRDEEFARKIAALNVQNIGGVTTPEGLALAKKYGLRVYELVIGVEGSHQQVMLPEEEAIRRWYLGEPMPSGMSKDEQRRWRQAQREAKMKRLRSVGYSDGGEPRPGRERSEVLGSSVSCFVGPAARSNAVARVLAKLDANPFAEMVLFDFVGYQNYRRCHHPDCERLYREPVAFERGHGSWKDLRCEDERRR